MFLAFVEGQNYSPVLLAVDPLGISAITTRFAFYGGEEVALFSFNNMNGGLWYSSTLAPQAVAGRGKPIRMLADASHYEIDTTLDGVNLRGTTTITFTPLTDGIRMLPLSLFARLRFTSASMDGAGAPVPLTMLQGDPADAAALKAPRDESGSVDVAVLFREPLVRGTPVKRDACL